MDCYIRDIGNISIQAVIKNEKYSESIYLHIYGLLYRKFYPTTYYVSITKHLMDMAVILSVTIYISHCK